MINNGIPYSTPNTMPGTAENNIPTPDINLLNRRETFVFMSKPIGTNIPDPTAEANYAWYLKNWFMQFKDFAVNDVPLPGDNRLDMVKIAGDEAKLVNNRIVVRSIDFINYGVRPVSNDVNDRMQASLAYSTRAIPQSRFENSPVVDWAGNGFRPQVIFDGSDLFSGLTGAVANNADFIVGLSTPYSDEPNAVVPVFYGNLRVNAGVFVPVPTDLTAFTSLDLTARRATDYTFQQQLLICKIEVFY